MRGSGAWRAATCGGAATAAPAGCGGSSASSPASAATTAGRTDASSHQDPLPAVPDRDDVLTSVLPLLDRLDG